jgi:hypothetical protein
MKCKDSPQLRKTIRALATFVLVSGQFAQHVYAQQADPNERTREFSRVIRGAENPELVPDSSLYRAISRRLTTAPPPGANCSDINLEGFSTMGPCIEIEGVEIDAARQLAFEFLESNASVSSSRTAEFCDDVGNDAFITSSPRELGLAVEELERLTYEDSAEFFEIRGVEILGPQQFQALVDWGNKNLRPSIDVIFERYSETFQRNGFPIDTFLESMCEDR